MSRALTDLAEKRAFMRHASIVLNTPYDEDCIETSEHRSIGIKVLLIVQDVGTAMVLCVYRSDYIDIAPGNGGDQSSPTTSASGANS